MRHNVNLAKFFLHVSFCPGAILSFSTTMRQNDVHHFVHAPNWHAALNHLTEKIAQIQSQRERERERERKRERPRLDSERELEKD